MYLQGIHFQRLGEAWGFEKAGEMFHEALEMDPEYAPAWAALGLNYWHEIAHGIRKLESGIDLALDACERAVSIDDSLASAQTAKGMLAAMFRFDWAMAEDALDAARSLAPGSAEVALHSGGLAKSRGQFEQAIQQLRKAIALDPLNTTAHIWMSAVLMAMGRLDEGRELANQILALYPKRNVAHGILSRIHLLENNPQSAFEEIQKEPEGFWHDFGMVVVLHALGREDACEAAFQALREDYAGDCAFQEAEIQAYRGQYDEAFEALEEAFERRDAGMSELHTSQFLAPIRKDPRWVSFLDRFQG